LYYLIYETTNNVNGKKYIGSHKTRKLDDGYLGSGKYFVRALKKYGMDNFSREILSKCQTEEDMYALEAELVTEALCKDRLYYNLRPGGSGGFSKSEAALGRIAADEVLQEKMGDDFLSQLGK
jgi:hypothetical protein